MSETTPTSSPAANNNSMIMAAILILLIIAGAAWYMMRGQNTETSNATPTAMPAEDTTREVESTAPSGAEAQTMEGKDSTSGESNAATKTITVNGDNFKFEPAVIKVKQGDIVQIDFKNTGGFHDWVLDEFAAKTKQIGDGQTDSVVFVASKKGTFEYYCSVGKHREMGMKGQLIVE